MSYQAVEDENSLSFLKYLLKIVIMDKGMSLLLNLLKKVNMENKRRNIDHRLNPPSSYLAIYFSIML